MLGWSETYPEQDGYNTEMSSEDVVRRGFILVPKSNNFTFVSPQCAADNNEVHIDVQKYLSRIIGAFIDISRLS